MVSEAVAGVRWGEIDVLDEEQRRSVLKRALEGIAVSPRRLRANAQAPDAAERIAEAEAELCARGFRLAVLDEAPDGWKLAFAERAVDLVDALSLEGNGETLDGCSGRCRVCPQRGWCDFGREVNGRMEGR